jgi:hypothetical protein
MDVVRVLFILPLLVLAIAATSAPHKTAAPRVKTDARALAAASRTGTVLRGSVVRIDYIRGRMLVREQRKRTVDVYILPSTNIEGKNNGYHTIADLKKGTHVEILTSVRGTHTDAEIIKLR